MNTLAYGTHVFPVTTATNLDIVQYVWDQSHLLFPVFVGRWNTTDRY